MKLGLRNLFGGGVVQPDDKAAGESSYVDATTRVIAAPMKTKRALTRRWQFCTAVGIRRNLVDEKQKIGDFFS